MNPTALAGLALATLATTALADDPSPGHTLSTGLPYPGQTSARTLSSGEIVTFDGASIDRWGPDGTHLLNLGTFQPARYGGCFEVAPDESFVLLGETGDVTDPLFTPSGDLYRVPLDGSGPAVLGPETSAYLNTLVFNYDAAFEDATNAIVSAAEGGFGAGNDLVRLDTATGQTSIVAHVSGPSGPLTFDPLGNLWYATQSADFPAPPGATNVVFFPGPLPTTGPALSEANTVVFATGFDGATDLAWESSTSAPLLAENNFATGTNRIYQVGNTPGNSTVLIEGSPFSWISGLETELHGDPQTFHPYQPEGGDLVRYLTTDYWSSWDRVEVRPSRPVAAFTGPGATAPGIGLLTLQVEGGPPGGDLIFLAGVGSYLAEAAYSLPGVAAPLFSGMAPAAHVVIPGTFPLDASGAGGVSILHDGSLLGLISAQALLLDHTGATVGTSTGAEL